MIGGRTDGRLQAIEARDNALQRASLAVGIGEGQAWFRRAKVFNRMVRAAHVGSGAALPRSAEVGG